MSLYNMIFKENPDADRLLSMLDLERDAFGRYRDVYLSGDGEKIIVYTRCGGDNRFEYDKVFEAIEGHPQYIQDYDDDYDETYCYFEFYVPEQYKREASNMATGTDPLNVHEKFEEAMREMQKPGTEAAKRAEEVVRKIQEGIDANPQGGIIRL